MFSSAFYHGVNAPLLPNTIFIMMAVYDRRYVPELKDMPLLYLFEPWKAPVEVQRKAGCVVGRDYPPPMVDHKQASSMCKAKMEKIKSKCQGEFCRRTGCLSFTDIMMVKLRLTS